MSLLPLSSAFFHRCFRAIGRISTRENLPYQCSEALSSQLAIRNPLLLVIGHLLQELLKLGELCRSNALCRHQIRSRTDQSPPAHIVIGQEEPKFRRDENVIRDFDPAKT